MVVAKRALQFDGLDDRYAHFAKNRVSVSVGVDRRLLNASDDVPRLRQLIRVIDERLLPPGPAERPADIAAGQRPRAGAAHPSIDRIDLGFALTDRTDLEALHERRVVGGDGRVD